MAGVRRSVGLDLAVMRAGMSVVLVSSTWGGLRRGITVGWGSTRDTRYTGIAYKVEGTRAKIISRF